MKLKTIPVILLLLTISGRLLAQSSETIKNIGALKIDHDLKIDGILNEPDWAKAPAASGFKLNYPSDSAMASAQTVVKVLYNDRYLYIGARLKNGKRRPKKYVVSSLKRDFVFLENDVFGVIIDPFNDHTNGYGFYVNALGVQIYS